MRDLPRIVLLATMAGYGVLFGLSASAQDAARPAGTPCREDMERLCSDVKPGGGARIRCLKDHEDELSDACRAQIAEHSQQGHEHASKIVQACGDDAKKLCANVEPGNGGIGRCLRDHEADLSSACRDALAQPRR
jgi:hypothetical protein